MINHRKDGRLATGITEEAVLELLAAGSASVRYGAGHTHEGELSGECLAGGWEKCRERFAGNGNVSACGLIVKHSGAPSREA